MKHFRPRFSQLFNSFTTRTKALTRDKATCDGTRIQEQDDSVMNFSRNGPREYEYTSPSLLAPLFNFRFHSFFLRQPLSNNRRILLLPPFKGVVTYIFLAASRYPRFHDTHNRRRFSLHIWLVRSAYFRNFSQLFVTSEQLYFKKINTLLSRAQFLPVVRKSLLRYVRPDKGIAY